MAKRKEKRCQHSTYEDCLPLLWSLAHFHMAHSAKHVNHFHAGDAPDYLPDIYVVTGPQRARFRELVNELAKGSAKAVDELERLFALGDPAPATPPSAKSRLKKPARSGPNT